MATALEKKEERLEAYLKSEKEILASQEYTVQGRQMKKAELAEVRKGIKELEDEILRMGSGRKKGARVINIIPRG